MDFELNDEQKMFKRVVRDFCEAELKPFASEIDEKEELRWEAIRKMADIGILSLQIPEEYGGAEMDTISSAIAIEELGRACGSTGLSIAAHNGLGCAPIVNWGTDEQKEKYLPMLISGDYLGALGLTEPNAGSDLLNSATTNAVRDGDEWVINGTKAWITNPKYAPVIVVFLRTDKESGSNGFSMILVEPGTAGLTIHPKEKKMGVRGSPTQMLTFDNVRVPASNLLGEEGRGFHQTMQTLDGGRISIGALSIGLGQAALEEMVKYAKERVAFGKPISSKQAIQWMIADAATELEAARFMVYRAAWMKDQGKDFTRIAAMAKLKASEIAEKIARDAIQVHGSYGYSTEYPVERIYRDQRLMTIGEGTSEVQRMVIARRVLKDY